MSVGVKVVLLVEDNTMGEYLHPYIELGFLKVYTHMYTMVMDSSTKRWTFILPKFDEPFALGSILKDFFFLRTDVGWCEGHTLCWK